MDFVEGLGLRGAELDESGGTNGEARAFECATILPVRARLTASGLMMASVSM